MQSFKVMFLGLCSKQVDTFGSVCIEENKYLYSYKGKVDIPPLGMVDDLICVSECGYQTTMIHTYMKFKTDSLKKYMLEKQKRTSNVKIYL